MTFQHLPCSLLCYWADSGMRAEQCCLAVVQWPRGKPGGWREAQVSCYFSRNSCQRARHSIPHRCPGWCSPFHWSSFQAGSVHLSALCMWLTWLDVCVLACLHVDVELGYSQYWSHVQSLCSPCPSRIPASNMAATSHVWLQIFKFEWVKNIKLKMSSH